MQKASKSMKNEMSLDANKLEFIVAVAFGVK